MVKMVKLAEHGEGEDREDEDIEDGVGEDGAGEDGAGEDGAGWIWHWRRCSGCSLGIAAI
jgi:hypothetical protein